MCFFQNHVLTGKVTFFQITFFQVMVCLWCATHTLSAKVIAHTSHHAVQGKHHSSQDSSQEGKMTHGNSGLPPAQHPVEGEKSPAFAPAPGMASSHPSTALNSGMSSVSPSPQGSLVRRLANGAFTTLVDGTVGTVMNSATALKDAGSYAVAGTKDVAMGAKNVVQGIVDIGGNVKNIVVATGMGAMRVAKDLKGSKTEGGKAITPESDVDALLLDIDSTSVDVLGDPLLTDPLLGTESLDGTNVASNVIPSESLQNSASNDRVDNILRDVKGTATEIKKNVQEIASKAGDTTLDGLSASADATRAFSGAAKALYTDPILSKVPRNIIDTAASTVTGVAEAALSDATLGASTVILKDVKVWLPDINASEVVGSGINTVNDASVIVSDYLHEKKDKRDQKKSQNLKAKGGGETVSVQIPVAKKGVISKSALPESSAPSQVLPPSKDISDPSLENLLTDISTMTTPIPESPIVAPFVAVAPAA